MYLIQAIQNIFQYSRPVVSASPSISARRQAEDGGRHAIEMCRPRPPVPVAARLCSIQLR
jgi:hypothetical protein